MKMIWAEGLNNGLGKDGDLLWHISEDLKFFKESTLGSPVIMGRKTYDSLPFKPLPKRVNVVLSSTLREDSLEGVQFVSTLDEALKKFPNAWVIGGSSLYEIFMPYTNLIRRTVIEAEKEADVFAPVGWESDFELLYSKQFEKTEKNPPFRFEEWVRKDDFS